MYLGYWVHGHPYIIYSFWNVLQLFLKEKKKGKTIRKIYNETDFLSQMKEALWEGL